MSDDPSWSMTQSVPSTFTQPDGLADPPSLHLPTLDRSSLLPRTRHAWVVFLLSTPSYLPGILILAHSLRKHKTIYPLIVAINPTLDDWVRPVLEEYGLQARVVQPIKPSGEVKLIAPRFVDTWTKLALFDFEEYDVSSFGFAVRNRRDVPKQGECGFVEQDALHEKGNRSNRTRGDGL